MAQFKRRSSCSGLSDNDNFFTFEQQMIINHEWAYLYYVDRTHVIPVGDYRDHEVEDQCWCGARVNDENVVQHKALDNRERFEGVPVQ